jgi:hypothetical protein
MEHSPSSEANIQIVKKFRNFYGTQGYRVQSRRP